MQAFAPHMFEISLIVHRTVHLIREHISIRTYIYVDVNVVVDRARNRCIYAYISLSLLFPILVGQFSTWMWAFQWFAPTCTKCHYILYTCPVLEYMHIYLDVKCCWHCQHYRYGYLSFTPLPDFGWPTFHLNASISNDLSPCICTNSFISIALHIITCYTFMYM